MEDVVGKIVSAAKHGELTKADRLIDELTFDALEEASGRTEFLFGVAVMFEAGQVTGEGRTMFDEQGLPDLPSITLDSMLFGFRMQQIEAIRRETVEVLAQIEVDRKEAGKVVKADMHVARLLGGEGIV